MSFTWFNINAGYGNQLSNSGTNFTNISFPPGVSSYSDLDTYIKEKTIIKNLAKTMSTSSLLQLMIVLLK